MTSASANTPERLLITGGAGFIGSHLTEFYLSTGKQVIVMDDLSTGQADNLKPFLKHPKFRFVQESVMNEAVLDRLAGESDTLIHLAAAVGVQLIVDRPVRTIRTNITGTERVLEAANKHKLKVLLASTSEVYGKGVHIPFREDDDVLLGPSIKSRWSYAASKLVDEFLGLAHHREHGLPVVIFRLFNTIGPRQRGRYGMVVPRFIKQALQSKAITVYGDGAQQRCFCDVRDVIKAIAGLAAHPEAIGKVFNIGNTVEISIGELAQKVLKITGSSSPISFIPHEEAYAPGFEDMTRRVPDITRITKLLNWKPEITLDQTLAAVRDYMAGVLESRRA